MAFGILEDAYCSSPTGTAQLEALDTSVINGSAHVILNPTPSSDPRDPLKFSKFRKELLFLTVVFGACLTGVIGPLLVPGFGILVAYFGVTVTKITLLNGALVMALGVSAYVCGCLAVILGKRLIFLVTTVILVVSCVWGACSQSYHSLLGARVLQGKSATLVDSSILIVKDSGWEHFSV